MSNTASSSTPGSPGLFSNSSGPARDRFSLGSTSVPDARRGSDYGYDLPAAPAKGAGVVRSDADDRARSAVDATAFPNSALPLQAPTERLSGAPDPHAVAPTTGTVTQSSPTPVRSPNGSGTIIGSTGAGAPGPLRTRSPSPRLRGKAREGSAPPSQAAAPSRILDEFDWSKLREHVEAADKARAPTQPELAEAYDTDMLNAIAIEFPHVSLDEIVRGVAAQDPRMLQHGQSLLARRLRPLRRRGKTGATS